MADNIVQVVFGAQTSGAEEGIERVRSRLGSVGEAGNTLNREISDAFNSIGESIKIPLEGLADFQSSLRETAELAGAAFAFDQIKEFGERMAELGEKTLNQAFALGLSVQQLAKLQGVFTLSGASADEAERSFLRLGVAVRTALAEPNSAAARAFTDLGISLADVRAKGTDFLGIWDLIVQHVSDASNKYAAVATAEQLVGRGIQSVIPALRQGTEGYKELEGETTRYQEAVERNTPAEAAAAEALNRLKLETATLAHDGFGLLSSAVEGSYERLGGWTKAADDALRAAQGVRSELSPLAAAFYVVIKAVRDCIDVVDALIGALNVALGVMENFAAGMARVVNSVGAAVGALATGHILGMGQAFGDSWAKGGAIAAQEMQKLQDQYNRIKNDLKDIAVGPSAPAISPSMTAPPAGGALQVGNTSSSGRGRGGRAGRDTTNSDYQDFAEGERLKIEEAQGDWSKISAVYDEWLAHAAQVYGQDSRQFEQVQLQKERAYQQHVQQMFRGAEESYSAQKSLDNDYLSAFKANMAKLVAEGQISKQQAIGFETQYTQQLREQLSAQLAAIMANDQLTLADKRKVWEQTVELGAEYDAKLAELEAKAAEDSANAWKDAAKQLADSFSNALSSVLDGTKTWAQAIGDIFRSLIKDTLQSTLKSVFTSVLGGGSGGGSSGGSGLDLSSALFGSGGLGGLITKGLGGSGGLFGAIGNLFSGGAVAGDQDFSGGSGAGGGGLLGWLFGGLGKLLPSFAQGGIVPSAAGGWMVPNTSLAMLHTNEMVLPANISQGLQGMLAGGGSPVMANFNVQAFDSQSTAAFFRNNGAALVGALNQAMRNGAALRVRS